MNLNGGSAMVANQTKIMLVTANVGSIFEDPHVMIKAWLKEFLVKVKMLEPMFLAVHFQEVGGKNYEESESMQFVNDFVKAMLASEELFCYDKARVFLDEDFTALDKFTALGSMYFAHESLQNIQIFDFKDSKFVPFTGREILSGNIDNVRIKEKAKFPQRLFPECRWSRKGFIRTRWNIHGCKFDCINIHLFHDASNIEAMMETPSFYCIHRQRAFRHTLERFENDNYEKVPYFVFGDFNFRLDTHALVKNLTKDLIKNELRSKKNNELTRLVYNESENDQKTILTVEKKKFDHLKMKEIFYDNNGVQLIPYDKETDPFRDKIWEYQINFPPSYPFSEEVSDGVSYMKTRCPGWCDRVLVSHCAKRIIVDQPDNKPQYLCIGKSVCMGDHKPIYLYFDLKPGAGKMPDSPPTHAELSHSPILARTSISINGEEVDTRVEEINIHDYATFDQEQKLHPLVRTSIKRKGETGHRFHDVALGVLRAEHVISKWKRTNHHHSSSSEDLSESTLTEEEDIDDVVEKSNNRQSQSTEVEPLPETDQPPPSPPTGQQMSNVGQPAPSTDRPPSPLHSTTSHNTDIIHVVSTEHGPQEPTQHQTQLVDNDLDPETLKITMEPVEVQQPLHAGPTRTSSARKKLSSLSLTSDCPCNCVVQ